MFWSNYVSYLYIIGSNQWLLRYSILNICRSSSTGVCLHWKSFIWSLQLISNLGRIWLEVTEIFHFWYFDGVFHWRLCSIEVVFIWSICKVWFRHMLLLRYQIFIISNQFRGDVHFCNICFFLYWNHITFWFNMLCKSFKDKRINV